jgi:predicted dienelactone hydrolase
LRSFSASDPSRPDRPISITVWYPANLAEGEANPRGVIDAPPDSSGAPYPLLLSSTKLARIFAPTLVSHGFTWASIDGIDTYYNTNPEMLNQPLDILFALEQVASSPPEGLEGMFDAENAGALGYSFDGYNALMLSGARLDPQHYLDLCQDPQGPKEDPGYWFEYIYNCGLAREWDAFTAEAGEELTVSEDGLWQPVTDPRIKAVMPLAADGYYLFGDKGLAAVNKPAMFIAGENDDLYAENALIYQHLGTPPEDKVFLTVLDRDHVSVIVEPATVARLRHFANAFFGYYLQDKQEYADYFSQEAVNQLEGMEWGVIDEN